MPRALFGFRIKPTNNFLGTDGSGDAVSIYEGGLVQYDHFLFTSNSPVSSVRVQKDGSLAEEIQAVLAKYANGIEALPTDIQNCTCDGSWYIFRFGDKEVTIDNPSRYEIRNGIAFAWQDSPYVPPYEGGEDLPFYNNTLLDILDEVSAVLDRYGLSLLHHIESLPDMDFLDLSDFPFIP